MARSGGRYVQDKDGKRRLVSRTQPKPRKVTAKAGNTVAPKPAPQTLNVSSVSAAEKEAK